ncbi:MAG: hypothetical protein DRP08_05450 [Candidatus Aenigmatarchaeota archaeon]|nr:MAG: hypothetical protein DRP08_05450 [Candidatus Aenigmarchaeota archaeon]
MKLPLKVPQRLILKEGEHNGKRYPREVVQEFYKWLKAVENKRLEPEQEFRQALSLFVGDDEDHKDSTGTWVGKIENVTWDEKLGAVRADLVIVDEDTARKVQFQLDNPPTTFAISPHLSVIESEDIIKDVKSKGICLVLNPAQGKDAFLGNDNAVPADENPVFSLKDIEVDLEDEKMADEKKQTSTETQDALGERVGKLEEQMKEMKELLTAQKGMLEKLAEAAERKDDSGEENQAKKKKAKDEGEGAEEEKEMQDKEKKDETPYPYKGRYGYPAVVIITTGRGYGYPGVYGYPVARRFELDKLNPKHLERALQDLKTATETLHGQEKITLEEAEKLVSTIDEILGGLPFALDPEDVKRIEEEHKKQEEELQKRAEELAEKRVKELLAQKTPRKGLTLEGDADDGDDKTNPRLGLRASLEKRFGLRE